MVRSGKSNPRPWWGCLLIGWLVTVAPLWSQTSVGDLGKKADAKILSTAASTYELITGYIEKDDYAKVQKEVRNLLDLKLPARFDPQVVDAIVLTTKKLSEKRQFRIAHAVVDMALKELGQREDNESRLLQAKAYIFKAEDKTDKALEYFNKSRGKSNKD